MQKFTFHNVKSRITCSTKNPPHFKYQNFLKLGGFCLVFALQIMRAVLHDIEMQNRLLKRKLH